MPRSSLIVVSLAALVLLSGCAAAGTSGGSTGVDDALAQPAVPAEPTDPRWAEIDGKTHYEGDWNAWFEAGTPDNGEFALFQQWRTPEKDAAGVAFLENDPEALGYSSECDDPASQNCIDTLSGFASFCQQLYDQAPAMLSLMQSSTANVADPNAGMLNVYCPDIVATYNDY